MGIPWGVVETQSGQPSPFHNSRPELRALTGLRGVAATIIALAHLQLLFPNNNGMMWNNAVDLFFCLSGFTLSYVYSRETFQFSHYLTARIARIYPLYFFTLIIAGTWVVPRIVNPTTYPAGSASTDFLSQIFMLNDWPVIGSGVHWNPVAWSISIEWFCYILLYPFLLFQKAPSSTLVRLLCMIVLSAGSYCLFVNYFDANLFTAEIYVPTSQLSYWVNLFRGVFGFTAGWIVFASFEKRDWLYAFCTRFSALIWWGVVFILFLRNRGLVNPQALVFLFPFVVLAATEPSSATSRLLGSKVLHFLGVISYSIYMMHCIVYVLIYVLGFHTFDTWPARIFAFATVLVVSTFTYFAIEVPARNAIRGLRRIYPAPLIP
jgi:peptidoglycan/LPS O-acetylase OafA/YrhL